MCVIFFSKGSHLPYLHKWFKFAIYRYSQVYTGNVKFIRVSQSTGLLLEHVIHIWYEQIWFSWISSYVNFVTYTFWWLLLQSIAILWPIHFGGLSVYEPASIVSLYKNMCIIPFSLCSKLTFSWKCFKWFSPPMLDVM